MAGNLPDGCIWPSDLDFYEWLNGPGERDDEGGYSPEDEDPLEEEELG